MEDQTLFSELRKLCLVYLRARYHIHNLYIFRGCFLRKFHDMSTKQLVELVSKILRGGEKGKWRRGLEGGHEAMSPC